MFLWHVFAHMRINDLFACQVECRGVDYVSDVQQKGIPSNEIMG